LVQNESYTCVARAREQKTTRDFIITAINVTGVLGGEFTASIFVVEMEVER